MEYLVAIVLGLVIGFGTTALGMHRDRALYPAMLIVIASYYDLFAVMGGSTQALIIESAVAVVFVALAVAGFKSTLWLAVVGIAGHGIFDFLRGHTIDNPGVPVWWPAFCGSIDVVLGIYLAWMLSGHRIASRPRPSES